MPENVNVYISSAGDPNSLKFAAIKLFYCGLEVRSSLELNKASVSSVRRVSSFVE
jgi:hypothetical protein